MKALFTFAFCLIISLGQAQTTISPRVDSLEQAIYSLELQNKVIQTKLDSTVRDMVNTRKELTQYHDMFKQQWNFFSYASIFIAILISVVGYISFKEPLVKISKFGKEIEVFSLENKELKNTLNSKLDDFESKVDSLEDGLNTRIEINSKNISSLLNRVYEIHQYIKYIPFPFQKSLGINLIAEGLQISYLRYIINPDNIIYISRLKDAISFTYSAIPLIKDYYDSSVRNNPGMIFKGIEPGVKELKSILNEIIENKILDEDIKAFASKAYISFDDTLNSLINDPTNHP
ncbi:hypothetical protein [Arundinibacter roseus]|uniref:Uncharacterized protein n=1 Tax=Arundinibacter roseus TaxID=2070510 RepID=A0A4R4KJV7_9BACT|nr:hypothetical protein [Arundinibacter roseus]TDB66821.1 hypothetical protein EZE20_06765 [Arundinibacter roseus]